MRSLRRNKRLIHYAKYLGSEPIKDEQGFETGEIKKKFGPKTKLYINYSTNVGEVATQVFGDITNYSRIMVFVGEECPLTERDILYIGNTEIPNYEVKKVADSINSFLIAIGEIV